MKYAWIYPGPPAENAQNEYRTRNIEGLCLEYQTLTNLGTIKRLTVATSGVNAYSAANAADVKAHSKEQYITISGRSENVAKMVATKAKRTRAIDAIEKLLIATGFTGAKPDWEPVWGWEEPIYTNIKQFFAEAKARLQPKGFKLGIDLPAIERDHPMFKYEDFTFLDLITIMAYDRQWDNANGSVADLPWLGRVMDYAKSKIPVSKLAVGIPTYGYHSPKGVVGGIIDTLEQSKALPGFDKAVRNADGELTRTVNGIVYLHSDTESINRKINVLKAKGVQHSFLWHLGGNALPSL